MKIYIPGDSAAQSVGSDLVAVAIAAEAAKRNLEITIVRNGTRGALWLEPLVEVEISGKRIGYPNVTVDDVSAILDGTLKSIGEVDNFEWLKSQDRITYKRVGIIDPLSLSDYEAHGGFVGLTKAQKMQPAEIGQWSISPIIKRYICCADASVDASNRWRCIKRTKVRSSGVLY